MVFDNARPRSPRQRDNIENGFTTEKVCTFPFEEICNSELNDFYRDGLAPAQPVRYKQELPREVPHHPGYSKHAAIEAIRRHAFNFLPRDITVCSFSSVEDL